MLRGRTLDARSATRGSHALETTAMPSIRTLTASLIGCVLLSLAQAPAAAGQTGAIEPAFDTRAQLRTRAEQLEARIARTGADGLREELRQVRRRLEEGDFRPGDAVEIRVPGSDTLSGVFQVEAGGRLALPVIGDVDMSGVLYAEADSVLRVELGRYVRTDRIDVRTLKRVAVVGAVGSPGYYDVTPSITVSDLLMKAGGPIQSSDLDKVEIRRDGQRVASADEGLRESATLAELGVQRGDQIRVPERSGSGSAFGTVMTVLGTATSLAWIAWRVF